jgi:hypothetical protein
VPLGTLSSAYRADAGGLPVVRRGRRSLNDGFSSATLHSSTPADSFVAPSDGASWPVKSRTYPARDSNPHSGHHRSGRAEARRTGDHHPRERHRALARRLGEGRRVPSPRRASAVTAETARQASAPFPRHYHARRADPSRDVASCRVSLLPKVAPLLAEVRGMAAHFRCFAVHSTRSHLRDSAPWLRAFNP